MCGWEVSGLGTQFGSLGDRLLVLIVAALVCLYYHHQCVGLSTYYAFNF